jgi:uncharacterized protein (TIGR02266 family)
MDQPPAKEPRGAVSLRIKFRSANLDQFIERYGVDVSRGGIFIRTREPLAVGTQLRFDFQLQDAAPLLAGEGTVVWIRENDPARAGVTPGMGVRFDKLTPASQPILEKILTDKGKREQPGATAKPSAAGGLAVRRPSSTFSALDPAAARAALSSNPVGAAPRVPAPALGSGQLKTAAGSQPRATAPAAGAVTLGFGGGPRVEAPATGSGPLSTRAAGARPVEPAAPVGVPRESSGAFGRPRSSTGMNAARPAPAPQALFEKPTADDIDRALSVLTEVDDPGEGSGAPAPPLDFAARDTGARAAIGRDGAEPPARVRKQTDAQPIVLESSTDVGDAPARRTGTRPLFSSPDLRGKTVPVVPIGGPGPDDDDEEDATSAWAGSGPTRVSDDAPDLEPDDEASAPPVRAPMAPPPSSAAAPSAVAPFAVAPFAVASSAVAPFAPTQLAMAPATTGAAHAPATAHDLPAAPAEAPKIMSPAFTSAAPKRQRSNAPFVILGLLVVGGGGFFVLKGLHLIPTPTATTAPAASEPGAATTAAVPSGEVTLPAKSETTDALAAAAPSGEAKPSEAKPNEAKPSEAKPSEAKPSEAKAVEAPPPEKVAEAKPTPTPPAAETATPSTLRAHPLGPPAEAPKEPAPAAAAPVKDSGSSHHSRRRSAATEGEPTPAQGAAAGGEKSAAVPPPDVLKITTTPAGAEVIVDGLSVGTTPYSANDLDPATPHSITLKKDGFEAHERMISSSDWQHAKGGAHALKITVKLHSTGHESSEPAKSAEPAAADPAPGLGTTPASPKRE